MYAPAVIGDQRLIAFMTHIGSHTYSIVLWIHSALKRIPATYTFVGVTLLPHHKIHSRFHCKCRTSHPGVQTFLRLLRPYLKLLLHFLLKCAYHIGLMLDAGLRYTLIFASFVRHIFLPLAEPIGQSLIIERGFNLSAATYAMPWSLLKMMRVNVINYTASVREMSESCMLYIVIFKMILLSKCRFHNCTLFEEVKQSVGKIWDVASGSECLHCGIPILNLSSLLVSYTMSCSWTWLVLVRSVGTHYG